MYQINFDTPVHVHFIGIGGISMSGLAEVLLQEGFIVSGSDSQQSALTRHLEEKGAAVFYGQTAENIRPGIDVVVYTAAIHPDNPEFAAAKTAGIPMLTRAELLGEMMRNYETSIAVAGTHGKTTTTSMISMILLKAQADPTISVGGILPEIGGNIRVGKSRLFLTEACEYTNSFLSFFPTVDVILNIEEDHMDFFKDLADIRHSFHRFAGLLPAHGLLVMNGEIENIPEITEGVDAHLVTCKVSGEADYTASDITYDEQGCASFTLIHKGTPVGPVVLHVPGIHNVSNALAALATTMELGFDFETASEGLSMFHGTERRFQYKGTFNGVTVVDDYAHHPSEIRATLKAAANYPHREIWCVFQPHTYTRTLAFMHQFAEALSLADHVVLAEIYPARETDNLGISSGTLQAELRKMGKECDYFSTFEEIEEFLLKNCMHGDLLITMGAGDVYKIGENLVQR